MTNTEIEEKFANGEWYKTEKGYYRYTEKGWNKADPRFRKGKDYPDYLRLVELEENNGGGNYL